MAEQTLAQGESKSAAMKKRYVPRGSTNIVVKPLNKCFMALVAETGQGKSHLLQSAPNNFIFNLDQKGTVNPESQAEMWPPESGQDILWSAPGGKDDPAYKDSLSGVVDDLVAARKAGLEGTPEMISIDSVAPLMDCAIHWAAWDLMRRQSDSRNLQPSDVTPLMIAAQDGRHLYPRAYGLINNMKARILQAGFGLVVVIHLAVTTKDVTVGNQMVKKEYRDLTITDNFKNQLLSTADLVLEVRRQEIITKVPTERTVKGKTVKSEKTERKQGQILLAEQDDPRLPRGLLKAPTLSTFPSTIEIVGRNAWQQLEAAYIAAQSETT